MVELLPSTSPIVMHRVGEPLPGQPFSFTAFGDSSYFSFFESNLRLAKTLAVPLAIHLGDMTYDGSTGAIDNFANDIKTLYGHSPTSWMALTGGNHDDCGGDGHISQFISRLPPQLPLDPAATADPKRYGIRYWFDYPPTNPYARFILVTPGEATGYNCNGYNYNLNISKSTTTDPNRNYDWLSAAIDDARARSYSWVIVCNHRNYISAGGKGDDIKRDFMELCLTKKVDLILQGHEHNYQRSKGLRFNGALSFPHLEVTQTGPGSFTKGLGTILMINGSVAGQGGTSTDPFNLNTDTDAKYFAAWMGNNGQTNPPGTFDHGSAYFRVTPTRIDGGFRPATGGTYRDDYFIG